MTIITLNANDSNMEKLTDILAMGGYASYVWPAYAVTLAALLALALGSWRQLLRARQRLAQLQQSGDHEA